MNDKYYPKVLDIQSVCLVRVPSSSFRVMVTQLYHLSYLCVGCIKIFYACIVILLHKEKCACRKPTILFGRLILFLSGNVNQYLSIQISNCRTTSQT